MPFFKSQKIVRLLKMMLHDQMFGNATLDDKQSFAKSDDYNRRRSTVFSM